MRKEKSTVGSRLRECRKAMGYSQEKLAEVLYMKKAAISKYENDQNDIPSSVVIELANTLNTTPNYLLLGAEEEEAWEEDVMRILKKISDSSMRKLAIKQLECIISI